MSQTVGVKPSTVLGAFVGSAILGTAVAIYLKRTEPHYTQFTGQTYQEKLADHYSNNGNMPTVVGYESQNPGGLLGSYVPSESYVYGGSQTSWSARPLKAASETGANIHGGFGLDTKQLFPSMNMPVDGFDDILISAPHDYLYADNLMDDHTVITSTRNQTYDLRGEPATNPAYSVGHDGSTEIGAFAGAYTSSIGPYHYRKPYRSYIV